MLSKGTNYTRSAMTEAQAMKTAPEAPDLTRIAETLDSIIEYLTSGVQSMDLTLDRIGRTRVMGDGASCSPLRSGLIGAIEDKLDRVSSLVTDTRDIAAHLNRIA